MTDDVAAGLIDALANEGEHVDDGRFTLDAAAALRKLREHQFTEPHAYVLLLVEAAWLAGNNGKSGGVTLDLGTTTTIVFTGVTLELGSLTEIFGAVLGRLDQLEGEALRRARIVQLLGLAATSALALRPSHIFIEACDAAGVGHGIRIEQNGEITDDPAPTARPRTIWFQLCGPWHDVERPEIERSLVLERCRQTSFPVRVDSQRVALGPTADLREDSTTPVMLEGEPIGLAGHAREHDAPAMAWIINRGVAIRDPIVGGQIGNQAVVEVDLALDLSRNKLVENDALAAVRAAIRAALAGLPTPAPLAPTADPAKPPLWAGILSIFAVIGIIILAVLASNGPASPTPEPKRDDPAACKAGSLDACTRVRADPESSSRARLEALHTLCRAGDESACAVVKSVR